MFTLQGLSVNGSQHFTVTVQTARTHQSVTLYVTSHTAQCSWPTVPSYSKWRQICNSCHTSRRSLAWWNDHSEKTYSTNATECRRWLGSARHGSARLGSARLGSGRASVCGIIGGQVTNDQTRMKLHSAPIILPLSTYTNTWLAKHTQRTSSHLTARKNDGMRPNNGKTNIAELQTVCNQL